VDWDGIFFGDDLIGGISGLVLAVAATVVRMALCRHFWGSLRGALSFFASEKIHRQLSYYFYTGQVYIPVFGQYTP
jgi:hypothetical protein